MSSTKRQHWVALAERHQMQLFERGHGLLHGAVRDYDGGRLVAIECPVGIELSHTGSVWEDVELVWADIAFEAWCTQSVRVAAAKAAAREVAKVSPVRSQGELARALPHLAKWGTIVCDDPEVSVRLRCLWGSPRVRDICEPRDLLALPECFCLSVLAGALSVYFPLVYEPEMVLGGFERILRARGAKG